MASDAFRVQTVCTGNICRSPMAATVLSAHLAAAGLGEQVWVTSSGVSSEEHGNPIDRRAVATLKRRGYQVDWRHRAHKISRQEIEQTQLLLPQAYEHYLVLRRWGALPERVKMMRQFAPDMVGVEVGYALDIDDPWYGGAEDFELALDSIEAATPGVVAFLRQQLSTRRDLD
jgi:protein-tyrosine phosphatase